MEKQFLIPTLIFTALGLTACGGSSDSSGTTTPSAAVSFTAEARMDLTSVNKNQAAAEGIGSTASTSVGGAAKGTGNSQSTNSRIVSLISSIKTKTGRRNKTVSNGLSNCASSGTQEFTYDDVTFDFTATFNNCSEYGNVMNGSLVGNFTDNGISTISTMSFTNFTMESSSLAEPFSMSMSGTMVVTSTEFTGYDRNSINGTGMIVNMTYSGRSISMGNYTMTYDDYYSAIPTYDVSTFEFDMNSSMLTGSLHVASTQNVYQYYTDDFPYAGQIKLSGANNGSFLITVIDATNIQLQTDADGDDTYEGNDIITWVALKDYLN